MNNQLILFPLDANYKFVNPDAFIRILIKANFIDLNPDSADYTDKFLPGKSFMKYLTFLGCSPSIGSNTEDENYNSYHVEIDAVSTEPRLYVNSRMRSPLCPKCNHQEKEKLASDGLKVNSKSVLWFCPSCGVEMLSTEINWKHRLAVTAHHISVNGVFEGEVVPADELLNLLAKESGVDWSYSYC